MIKTLSKQAVRDIAKLLYRSGYTTRDKQLKELNKRVLEHLRYLNPAVKDDQILADAQGKVL